MCQVTHDEERARDRTRGCRIDRPSYNRAFGISSSSLCQGLQILSEAPRVLIVGAGWIGRQVGLRMAICGLHVAFVDKKPQVLQDAERWMQASSAEYIACIAADLAHRHAALDSTQGAPSIKQAEPLHDGLATWNERTEFVVDVDKLDGRVEVVLECVSEQIGLKRRILREFSQRFPSPRSSHRIARTLRRLPCASLSSHPSGSRIGISMCRSIDRALPTSPVTQAQKIPCWIAWLS